MEIEKRKFLKSIAISMFIIWVCLAAYYCFSFIEYRYSELGKLLRNPDCQSWEVSPHEKSEEYAATVDFNCNGKKTEIKISKKQFERFINSLTQPWTFYNF